MGFYSNIPRFWWTSKQGSAPFKRFFYDQFRFDQQRYEHVLEDKVQPYFQQQVFPEARERIQEYSRQGAMQCIVSAPPRPLLERMAGSLGIDHCIATDLTVMGGRIEGAEPDQIVDAEEKAVRVNRFLQELDSPREELNVHAFGNSRHDIPLLQMADQAFAVNPDSTLGRVAMEESWTPLSWGQP